MNRMNFQRRWVLVTGASSGLGLAMAKKLAYEGGANLVLVARRKNLLDATKDELEAKAGVEVETIAADLSNLAEVDQVVQRAISGRQLYAAILNAGVTHFGQHSSLDWPAFEKMLHINVTSVVRMTTDLVPHLESNGLEGGLMLVSSMAGIVPVPYQSAYSGTKAFLVHFGCGLWHELQGRPVSITTYAPGGIVSEMTGGESFNSLRSWLMPVDRAAQEGLDAFARRKYLHVPGMSNWLGLVASRMLPHRLVTGQLAANYRRALKAAGQL